MTIDGVTTTTITYSDGTTEVETSVSTQAGQGSPSGQTYNAQGALGTNAQNASGSASNASATSQSA
jgi:hypothetical protein